MHDSATDALAAYRAANVLPTRMLCRSAVDVGAARIVFVSSAKVFGEGRATPYSRLESPAPADPYAQSKVEAESVVREVAGGGNLDWTIVRPPFVYGPGGKGNFPRLVSLMRLSARVPLPLGSIENRRSMIFVLNLVDLIHHAAESPAARRQILLPTDGRDLSTPELLRLIAIAAGSRARLFGCPPWVLRLAAAMIGRSGEMKRLTETLRLDSSHLKDDLNWDPPFSLEAALALSVQGAVPSSHARAHG
jgi:UDP-glucose 4-epimerase